MSYNDGDSSFRDSSFRDKSAPAESPVLTSSPRVLDELAWLAMRALKVTIAVITFDAPAVAGAGVAVMPGNAWAQANRDTNFVKLADPRCAVDLGLPFYAGTPLRNAAGARIGTLAVLDTAKRVLSDDDLAIVGRFARVAEMLVDTKRAR